jgi:molecular chaperone GrpE
MSTEPDNAAPNGDASPDAKPGDAAPEPREEAAAPAETPAPPTPEQKLAEAVAETARMRDQLLRTAADFDNFRKRSRKAEDDAQRRGREALLKDLLPVFDNLERAIQHAESAPEAATVAAGLRMVSKQFVDTLDRAGIKRIVSVGQAFDPTRHEAIQHLESAEHPAGVVITEVQPGYVIGDQLVRPAMVVVSKGSAA